MPFARPRGGDRCGTPVAAPAPITSPTNSVNRSSYGAAIWSHILRDQLEVPEADFWGCVRDGVKPDRGIPEAPSSALPADLVYLLLSRVGLAEAEVAAMDKDEAVARLQRYWTEGQ